MNDKLNKASTFAVLNEFKEKIVVPLGRDNDLLSDDYSSGYLQCRIDVLEAIQEQLTDNDKEVAEAFEVIKKAMVEDNPSEPGSYAHSWHCNISCMCADAIEAGSMLSYEDAHSIGNDAATRFMKLCFDVETKNKGG